MKSRRTLLTALWASSIALALAQGPAGAEPADSRSEGQALDLSFVFHLDADMHEQDVFVARGEAMQGVYRVTKADRDMAVPLYRTASAVPHAPFEPEKVGPYEPGDPLGFTLGEWLDAKGAGSYACVDGKGTLDIAFSGLVPDGVYTLWHFFMAMPTTDPFIGTFDLPVGARDGSDSVFRADSDGNARFDKSIGPCLQMSAEQLTSGLAVAYHSDGNTYGPLPGEFASNAHVQLFALLPARADQ